MASQGWNLFVLFIAIISALFFANLVLYLFDSPYRISILMSIILTTILIVAQLLLIK